MKNTSLKSRKDQRGFSLVELLVVVAVIGVIAAIAIPSIGSINASAKTAVAQRNAQNIVSMFMAGQAAGVTWVVTSRNACVADVVAGEAAPVGSAFAGQTFKVPNITGTDLTGTYKYIGFDASSNLFYDKAGGQSAT
jgi:prepilin-type N-terminal cleavage/methylation domain-containing protein